MSGTMKTVVVNGKGFDFPSQELTYELARLVSEDKVDEFMDLFDKGFAGTINDIHPKLDCTWLTLAAVNGSMKTATKLMAVPGIDVSLGNDTPTRFEYKEITPWGGERIWIEEPPGARSREPGLRIPFRLAVINGHLEMARLLADAGAKTDLRDYDGTTPLMLALQNKDNEAMVRFLLDIGQDPNAKDVNGCSVLMRAGLQDHTSGETVQMLLDAGADATVQNEQGTFLMFCA